MCSSKACSQTASYKIWTWIGEYTFSNDNHYATHISSDNLCIVNIMVNIIIIIIISRLASFWHQL